MNGGILTSVISPPVNAPMPAPIANISSTASAGFMPALTKPKPITVTSASRDPIDRSMPALVMTNVIAAAMMM